MPEPDLDLRHMLGAAFAAFQSILQSARSYENRDPDLFPAFISAGTAAANGRDAVLTATVFPAEAGLPPGFALPAPDASPQQAADAIVASAAVLANWLDQAVRLSANPQDQEACQDAAEAARQIQELMAAGEPHSR